MSVAGSSAPRPIVVIVDDDDAVANALKFRLELEGFDVRVRDDARTLLALGMIPGEACLVVDYSLPGMDGLQLLAQLRSAGLTAPAVMMVTNPSAALRAKAALADVSIVEKPLLNDALLAAVRRALVLKLV